MMLAGDFRTVSLDGLVAAIVLAAIHVCRGRDVGSYVAADVGQ